MTPVLRYFKNSYRKKKKHRYSVWTGIPPSSSITKEFLHKLSETVSGKLIGMLVVLIGVSTWVQFVIVTNLMASVTLERCSLHGWILVFTVQGRWQTACMASCGWAVCLCCDVVTHGGGGVMVWAGVCYGQRTQVHFIDGILNAQRYRDEILRPVVVPFIHDHPLMLQHDNARPHVARICTQFQKLKTSQSLHGQHTHRTCHPLSMFGSGSAYTTACSSSCQSW